MPNRIFDYNIEYRVHGSFGNRNGNKIKRISILVIILVCLLGIYRAYFYQPVKIQKFVEKYDLYGYPVNTIDIPNLIQLFNDNQFNKVNKMLDDLQKKYEEDFKYEFVFYNCYEAFAINNKSKERIFNEWIKKYPDSFIPYLARASYYHKRGWKARGGKWARETSDENFKRMSAYFAKSKRDIKKVLNISPDQFYALILLMNMERAEGEDERVKSYFNKALTKNPYSFIIRDRYMQYLRPRWGGSYGAMAGLAIISQEYIDQNPKLEILKGYVDWEKGFVKSRNDKEHEAIKYFDQALKYGEDWLFLDARADSYRYIKQYKEALRDYDRALEINPFNYKVLKDRLKTLKVLNRNDDALRDVETLKRLDQYNKSVRKNHVRVIIKKGYKFFEKKDYAKAIEIFDKAREINPRYYDVYYYLGLARSRSKKYDRAYQDLLRCMKLKPDYYWAYLEMDYVLFRQKRYDEIISFWNNYLRLKPDDARAYLERSGTYIHKKNYVLSLQDAQKSCDLGNKEGCEVAKKWTKKLRDKN